MPNWVKNNVSVTGNKQSLIDFKNKHIKNNELDFNTIIQMPSNIFQGNLGEEERKIHGKNNWYDWSIKHWGTKWNASNTYYDEATGTDDESIFNFSFDTAWACPIPIYEALKDLYPSLTFEVEYADEDIGSNCGTILIQNNEIMESDRYGEDDFAREVWGYEHTDSEDEEETESTGTDGVKFSW
jgi:hypothetical protein